MISTRFRWHNVSALELQSSVCPRRRCTPPSTGIRICLKLPGWTRKVRRKRLEELTQYAQALSEVV